MSFEVEIISHLPVELLLCVSAYLDLEDLMRARSVSRHWRRAFSNPDFCDGIARWYFRPTWENIHGGTDPDELNDKKQAFVDLLPRVASKRIRRLRGKYSSISADSYAIPNYTTSFRNTNRQYCNGRVAYNKDPESILVKNLLTNLAIVITEENRIKLEHWLLSDQFVIAWTVNPITLLTWRIGNPLDGLASSKIRLPSGIRHISACHDQVGIITAANEVMVWKIGGALRSLDISKVVDSLKGSKINMLALKFHPGNQGHIFVIFACVTEEPTDNEMSMGKIVIQDFFERTPGVCYQFDYRGSPRCNQTYPKIIDLEDGAIGCVFTGIVSDSSCSGFEQVQLLTVPPCGHEKPFEGKPKTYTTQVVVKFDIYTRKFSSSCHHHPNVVNQVWCNQAGTGIDFCWRDQVVLLVQDKSWEPFRGIDPPPMLAITIDCCTNAPFVPIARPFPVSQDYWHLADAIGQANTIRSWGSPEFNYIIRGDDDFLVLFGIDGYAVWCFDDDVQLPPLRGQAVSSGTEEI
ncbi:uncharacterized protein BP5553_02635 [Venustampulla echinocandica]|uniref:F-box domain-containing protein n=1 Tax=Venustampulla echinocandica TaxID=2656787 RepID=A0A370TRY3_9HELO|nr:uncharacterized protein BP5553_02635 [Venustampulla echinocandica]RDL38295.1 hypothetical protein BP5553_02635 [Venustampulla echinocandica]